MVVMPRLVTHREAAGTIFVAAVSLLCSAGLCVAALVLHPPAPIIPLLVLACIGFPVLGTWELPPAIAALRARRESRRRLIASLRRGLDQLPEIDHPLGH
jgi:hypothetical protein